TPRVSDAPIASAEQERILTWMAPRGTADVRDEEAEARLGAYLGVDLRITWIDEAMFGPVFETSAAAQKFPKVVTIPSRVYYDPLVRNSVKAGHFWEIGPYLPEYPNLRGLSGDILDRTAVGGKIYGLYHYEPAVNRTLFYREDW